MAAERRNVVVGVLRLAVGKADGLAQFGNTTHAFLASLAPLVAFPLVGGGLLLAQGDAKEALLDLLSTCCLLLAPAVLSEAIARWWGRDGLWLHYATAFNWCQWVIPAVAGGLLLAVQLLIALGLPNQIAANLATLALVSYALWLHWFLVRHGLQLPRGRAMLAVFAITLGTTLLATGPQLIAA